jgi:hypothetical protein
MSNDATRNNDGFDDDGASEQLLQGDILRCVDGVWSTRESGNFPQGKRMLVVRTTKALQHWEDQKPIDTIMEQPGKPLPDADELNEKIPESDWNIGLDGKPRPPWVLQHIAYLLDQSGVAASRYTFINSTKGARIAVARLRQKVADDHLLTGKTRLPIVELGAAPMKTPHGIKQRPDFNIVAWRDLDGNGGLGGGGGDPPKQIEHAPVAAAKPIEPVGGKVEFEKPAAKPTASDKPPFNDEIGF